MTGRFSLWVLVALVTMSLSACGGATAVQPTPTNDAMAHMLHPTTSAADLALPYDVRFIDGMMMHHLAAIDMSNAALQYAADPNVKALATAIIKDQSTEVTQLRDWRASWYPDAPMTAGTGADMGAMEVSSDSAIAYDVRWLNAMIDHHKGAVTMATEALSKAEHPELKTLATAIISAQTHEIEQMQGMLPK